VDEYTFSGRYSSRPIHYILNSQGEPEPEDDILRWGAWFENDERRIVRQQRWQADNGSHFVSTVFLGTDHNWFDGPPILWETMVFIDGEDCEQQRYSSRDEAIIGHNTLVARYGGVVLE